MVSHLCCAICNNVRFAALTLVGWQCFNLTCLKPRCDCVPCPTEPGRRALYLCWAVCNGVQTAAFRLVHWQCSNVVLQKSIIPLQMGRVATCGSRKVAHLCWAVCNVQTAAPGLVHWQCPDAAIVDCGWNVLQRHCPIEGTRRPASPVSERPEAAAGPAQHSFSVRCSRPDGKLCLCHTAETLRSRRGAGGRVSCSV